MKILTLAGCAVLSALALSGCGTLGNAPAQLAPVIDALGRAGCTGNLHFGIGAGSAAGMSPGAFHVENTFDGSCDPRNAKPVAAPTDPAPVVTK